MSDAIEPADYATNGAQRDEGTRVQDRFWTALTRGATAGCVLRGGLTIVGTLLALSRRKQRPTMRHPIEEILRMTFFLGSLGGIYVLVDEAVAALWGKNRTSSWRGFLAGLCAGPSLLWLGRDVPHNSMALYVLVRSLTLLIRCGNRLNGHRVLHTLLAPTRLEHGDVTLMCLAGAQIVYSYIMWPHTMPRSYRRFLDRHTGRDAYVWNTFKEMVLHEKCQGGEAVDRFENLVGTGHVPFCSAIPCRLLHPNKSCVGNVCTFLPGAYLRALMVYLPVYLAPAVLVHRKRLLTEAETLLPRVALGVLRSSLFLSSYIALAYSGVCAVHNAVGMTSPMTLIASLLAPGLATLLEKKTRRMELAMYSVSRAAEGCLLGLMEGGSLQKLPKRLDVLLFSLSVAIITHCYSDDEGTHRHAFRSKYLNVLDFVFGNSGIQDGAIHHTPSNQDLLKMGSHWWSNGRLGRLFRSWIQ